MARLTVARRHGPMTDRICYMCSCHPITEAPAAVYCDGHLVAQMCWRCYGAGPKACADRARETALLFSLEAKRAAESGRDSAGTFAQAMRLGNLAKRLDVATVASDGTWDLGEWTADDNPPPTMNAGTLLA